MDVSEIVTQLNNAGFEDTSTAEKMEAINDSAWDVESRMLWPFLEKTIALNFDGSSASPTNLPSDFKAVLWLYDNTNGTSLWPERLSTVRGRHGNQIGLVSDPAVYYFLGSSLRLWPIPPSSTGRYQLDYFATQPELTESSVESAILLPKRHHRVLLVGALSRLYIEDDPDQASFYMREYEERIAKMGQDLFGRQYQRSDQIFVIDEDDEFYHIY